MRIPMICLTLLCAATLQGCFPLAATGLAASALMMDDRRTSGIYIEDENIEWKSLARAREKFRGVHISTTSYNLNVLLTGQAPTEEVKNEITEVVRAIPSVKKVNNEIAVSGNVSLAARGNDAIVTSNVKARLLGNGKVSPNHIKVVTENGIVYLMGIVTQQEGDAAAEVARTTSGVARVIKVFEYIDQPPKL